LNLPPSGVSALAQGLDPALGFQPLHESPYQILADRGTDFFQISQSKIPYKAVDGIEYHICFAASTGGGFSQPALEFTKNPLTIWNKVFTFRVNNL